MISAFESLDWYFWHRVQHLFQKGIPSLIRLCTSYKFEFSRTFCLTEMKLITWIYIYSIPPLSRTSWNIINLSFWSMIQCIIIIYKTFALIGSVNKSKLFFFIECYIAFSLSKWWEVTNFLNLSHVYVYEIQSLELFSHPMNWLSPWELHVCPYQPKYKKERALSLKLQQVLHRTSHVL